MEKELLPEDMTIQSDNLSDLNECMRYFRGLGYVRDGDTIEITGGFKLKMKIKRDEKQNI